MIFFLTTSLSLEDNPFVGLTLFDKFYYYNFFNGNDFQFETAIPEKRNILS